jgi:hypothetical protein
MIQCDNRTAISALILSKPMSSSFFFLYVSCLLSLQHLSPLPSMNFHIFFSKRQISSSEKLLNCALNQIGDNMDELVFCQLMFSLLLGDIEEQFQITLETYFPFPCSC